MLRSAEEKIIFRDSLRLLPASLRSLGKSFNVDVSKGIFPYNFVSKETINYVGPHPTLVTTTKTMKLRRFTTPSKEMNKDGFAAPQQQRLRLLNT